MTYKLESIDLFKLATEGKRLYERRQIAEPQVDPNTYAVYNVAAIELEERIDKQRRLDEVMRIARTRDPKYFVEVNKIVNKVVREMGIQ